MDGATGPTSNQTPEPPYADAAYGQPDYGQQVYTPSPTAPDGTPWPAGPVATSTYGMLYDPGRPGPPLILGIVVFLIGPILAIVGLGKAAVSSLDLSNTGPVVNHSATILHGDATFMFGTPAEMPGSTPCRVRLRNGPAVDVKATSPETVSWGTQAYVVQGSFYIEKSGNYVIDCPKAGHTVLLVPVKGTLGALGWSLGKWLLIGALVSIMGLLMMIFRRKKPREVRA